MPMDEFAGQRIAVIGLAATGLAAARVLRDRGARVRVYEAKPEERLSAETVRAARGLGAGVMLSLGSEQIDWADTDLVVPSPGVPRSAASLRDAVRRGVPVLGEIEVAYRLARAPILAITGTNGKTTTTALLGAICREAGRRTWVAGNIAEDAGQRLPLILAAVEAPEDGVIVAEISSFQLEWVERFRPRVGAWLNVANDHLDRHADFDEYARAKARLFATQGPDDAAVLNGDDDNVVRYGSGAGSGRRLLFSLEREAAGCLRGETLWVAGQRLMDAAGVPLPGRHNVANVLAAACMAADSGISLPSIRAAVSGFQGVAHRMELVATRCGVRYVNNSMCTNPAAVAASLEAAGGPVVAIMGGKHKGGDLSAMARSVKESANKVILIGVSAPEIAAALASAGMRDVERADTLPDAVRRASSAARPGDTVMLVPGCASFDMFNGFEHRGQVFREAVKELTGERDA
uniref:UDP-N-acetylmuramoylalanine--D-glutamate ligase n=1 Tax=uncultured Armatimonadetes bacterium TaxID=157466 RepID=A0A6J4IXY6_9BACT|nr:UDP-N-acetylmuramoylalanine--D-glutamate ligase [uncultured Armatimonadetes bacterium]